MPRILVLLYLAFCLPSCLQIDRVEETQYMPTGIDDQFNGIITEFEKLWGHQVTNVNIFFVDHFDPEGEALTSTLAVCMPWAPRSIAVLKPWWFQDTDPSERELVMFHELGHCVLDRDHDETLIRGKPKSIMYPYMNPVFPEYKKHRDYYVKELLSITAQDSPGQWECRAEEDL